MGELCITNVVSDYSFCTQNRFNILKYGGASKAGTPKILYPTLRIFGILDSGSKCCVHVHGCLPYIVVRTRSPLNQEFHNHLLILVKQCIAQGLFESKNKNGKTLDSSPGCPEQVLYGIFQERGKSLYGFHESQDYFVRIYFYNPIFLKTFADFLHKECEQREWLQPYNAHIPFTLQFFIDFSLHGMDRIYFRNAYFRRGHQNKFPLSPLESESNCASEFDVFTDDIMNPWLHKERTFESIGLDFIWREEERRCSILKMPPPSLPKAQSTEEIVNHEVKAPSIIYEGGSPRKLNGSPNKVQQESSVLEDFKEILRRLRDGNFGSNSNNNQQQQSNAADEAEKADEPAKKLFRTTSNKARRRILPQHTELMLWLEGEDSRSTFDRMQQIWEAQEYRTLGFDCAIADGLPKKADSEKKNSNNASIIELSSDSDEQCKSVIDLSSDSEENEEQENRAGPSEINGIDLAATPSKDYAVTRYTDDGLEKAQFSNNAMRMCTEPRLPPSLALNVEIQQPQCSKDGQKTGVVKQRPQLLPSPRTPLSLNPAIRRRPTRVVQEQEKLLRGVQSNVDHLCALSMEVLAFPANGRPIADPKYDRVYAVAFAYHRDICNWQPGDEEEAGSLRVGGVLIKGFWEEEAKLLKRVTPNMIVVETEEALLAAVENFVQRLDPELLIGYDSKRFSWGYLFERAQQFRMPLASKLSRIKVLLYPPPPETPFRQPHGRVIIDVWWNARKYRPMRCLRFASVVKELLQLKFPAFDENHMDRLFHSEEFGFKSTLFKYFLRKTALNLELLSHMDLFVRTSQMARVYGIQFEGVLTRGSQFRVESMLLRIASQRRFFAPSVSVDQRNKMPQPEHIALVMEPLSAIYRDPVVVLDFQSLYPSIAIAHNYCYSTCLGRLLNYQQKAKPMPPPSTAPVPSAAENEQQHQVWWIPLGALSYSICRVERLNQLVADGQLTVAPNGAIFVRKNVRRGLLAILLQELLDTRVMVKTAMKAHREDRKLISLLDARQLALKLIANVTYGYTAAIWTGRMPCIEVADAIVSKGRQTLERAIAAVDRPSPTDKYRGARVVYGDTDSLFIHCKGCSREEAFAIGHQIAQDVTARNPTPIKLKFEKVMQPCCLLAKKRYMGMCYESPEEKEGTFDAKGIETIRRDSPPFVARVMEHFLRLLFDESIGSALRYLDFRLSRLGRTELDEFFLSVDYTGHYPDKSKSAAYKIASQLTKLSPRLTPVYGERLVYVICTPRKAKTLLEQQEQPAVTLYSKVCQIDKFLRDPQLQLDFDYYVKHQLAPALQRVLDLVPVKLPLTNKFKPHLQCIGCKRLGSHPWCQRCTISRDTYRAAYCAKTVVQQSIEQLGRFCLECIEPVKEAISIEGFPTKCSNFGCPVNRRATALARQPLALALEQHTLTEIIPIPNTVPR